MCVSKKIRGPNLCATVAYKIVERKAREVAKIAAQVAKHPTSQCLAAELKSYMYKPKQKSVITRVVLSQLET